MTSGDCATDADRPKAPRPPSARLASIDALRALALLAVVVVNFGGYGGMPMSGLPPPAASEGLAGQVLAVMVQALLAGKGIALLMFLFGYSLTLGGQRPGRLNRLLGLGLVHGFVVYAGDIVSQYALVGKWLGRWRAWRTRQVVRAVRRWLIVGLVVQVALGMILLRDAANFSPEADTTMVPVADQASVLEWLWANAGAYAGYLVTVLTALWFWLLGWIGLGVLAGRLRLLSHRRWRPLLQRLARWAGPMLVLQLVWAAWMMDALLADADPVAHLAHSLMGHLAVLVWGPWLLLRVSRWPALLVAAGRQTLSLYLACSLISVGLWCDWALGWRPTPAVGVLSGVLLWAVLIAIAAGASRAGVRLPAEAWLASTRRPAADAVRAAGAAATKGGVGSETGAGSTGESP